MRAQAGLRRLIRRATEGLGDEARAVLAPLYRYDESHGGDLVRTLSSYLEHGCNASRCAESLYLHRSGLLYRLGRIQDLLGIDLDSFENRVALEIALVAVGQAGSSHQEIIQ